MQPHANNTEHTKMASGRAPRLRLVGVLGTAVGATGVLTWWLQHALVATWDRITGPTPASAADLITVAVIVAALAVVLFLAGSVAVTALAETPGALGRRATPLRDRWSPLIVRRMTCVALGIVLTTAATPAASLADTTSVPPVVTVVAPTLLDLDHAPGFAVTSPPVTVPEPVSAPAAARVGLNGAAVPGWQPTRPLTREQPSLSVLEPGRGVAASDADVVVVRGDTLWGIAARDVGPDATDAEIAAATTDWYTANRDVVGPDPDLILPGQVLHAPRLTESTR